VVANSAFSAEECERWLGIPKANVSVIRPGVDERFRPARPAELDNDRRALRALGVEPPYLLQVGAYEPHKGGHLATGAIQSLRAEGTDVALVRCGPPRAGLVAGPGVIDLGYVDDTALVALYRSATAVVVTSQHEGFGLPAVEAMACGTPAVVVDSTALKEAGGGAAVVVRPAERSLVEALGRLLHDKSFAAGIVEAGFRRAKQCDWSRAGDAMLEELRSAAPAFAST
jgi:alpha-1,3-rhamnosyl/mannosyltransferase